MNGLDTNILLRFLTDDHPVQSAATRHAIKEAERRGETLFVSEVALCELVWVLSGKQYRYRKTAMAHILEVLLETPVFVFRDRQLVRSALHLYRERDDVDFADCLIHHLHLCAGCEETWTFDSSFAEATGVRLLG